MRSRKIVPQPRPLSADERRTITYNSVTIRHLYAFLMESADATAESRKAIDKLFGKRYHRDRKRELGQALIWLFNAHQEDEDLPF